MIEAQYSVCIQYKKRRYTQNALILFAMVTYWVLTYILFYKSGHICKLPFISFFNGLISLKIDATKYTRALLRGETWGVF